MARNILNNSLNIQNIGQDIFGTGNIKLISARTSNFVVPGGVYVIRVSMIGAGGSGGAVTGTYYPDGAGGGGGGGYSRGIFSVTPGQVIPVTVGLGGAGVTGTSTFLGDNARPGNDGGITSFGAYLSIEGGKGGKGNTVNDIAGGAGGAGGAGSVGNMGTGGNGGRGSTKTLYSSTVAAGGGGGACGVYGKGGNGGDAWNLTDSTRIANSTYQSASYIANAYSGGGGGVGGDAFAFFSGGTQPAAAIDSINFYVFGHNLSGNIGEDEMLYQYKARSYFDNFFRGAGGYVTYPSGVLTPPGTGGGGTGVGINNSTPIPNTLIYPGAGGGQGGLLGFGSNNWAGTIACWLGGGSGGASMYNDKTSPGGAGIVMVEW